MALYFNALAEGVVYRLERFDKKINRYVPYIIAKVVRLDKEDGKYLKEGQSIWMWEQ